jgi:glycine/D-amino acid oxidase-like deaminating enzyme/nitrite reductase/ring-hydroxylating ferredoxin subunit
MSERSASPSLPYWMETPLPAFPALDRDIAVDVVVVGGGLTGITTAYLLRNEGVRVALLERGRMAAADSGHTTAHLTYVTDYRLHELVRRFGKDGARMFWRAGAAAIDQIEAIVAQTGADCEFRRVPGYLHDSIRESDPNEVGRLHEDANLAAELGFAASFVDSALYGHRDLGRPGVRFENQAKFHPRKYLHALLRTLPGEGSYVFEQTAFEGVEKKPLTVHANGKRIRCDYIVIATHNPLMGMKGVLGATLFQTKLSLYTSYVLGARLPKDTLPEALYWDTGDPYDYLRVDNHPDHQYVIFGGEDVKTGQEDTTAEVFHRLRTRFSTLLPGADIRHRWVGQVVETDDGLPFIGENADCEFIATGFCGNGFTLGTVSAMMVRDRYLGRENAWFDLFRVDRKPFHGGLWRYLTENVDFPVHFVRDRLKSADGEIEDVRPGEGKIVSLNGDKVAAYRDQAGELTLCSPVCTHMKCLVRWNAADKTWDCPCHGSRFHSDGSVHSGPAETPLLRLDAAGRPHRADKTQRRDTPTLRE